MKNEILKGNALTVLKKLPAESVDMVITSPPYYGLRDYNVKGQIGLEPTLKEYIDRMLVVTAECKRVLKKTGTLWWNHGDSYGGSNSGGIEDNKAAQKGTGKTTLGKHRPTKDIYHKCLILQAHRLAIRMIDEQGWILRNTIIWHKPNAMPSSVKDRFTVDYEPIFFFSKSKKYYFERQFEPHLTQENRPDGIVRNREYGYDSKENKLRGHKTKKMKAQPQPPQHHGADIGYGKKGRNKRTVWRIPTKPFPEAHFAVYPETLCETPIKAGCPEGGVVLDPFFGAGTTGLVAQKLNRNWIGIELNPEYIAIAENRLKQANLV